MHGSDTGDERPEGAAPADQKERGEERQHRGGRDGDAHRAHGAEARGRVHAREGEAEQCGNDRARRRGDRWACVPERDPHRLVLVLDEEQLLPVASGQEQRVVGPRAEHEDEEDPTGLTVDDEPGLRQERADAADDGFRDHDGEERQRPEDGAAIDEDEEHEHQARRGEEQGGVDPLERPGRIRGEAGRAGDPGLEPRREAVLHDVADVVDRCDEDIGVTFRLDRDSDHGAGAVLREGDRRRGAGAFDAGLCDRLPLPLDSRPRLRGEPGRIAEDGDRGRQLAGGEAFRGLAAPRRTPPRRGGSWTARSSGRPRSGRRAARGRASSSSHSPRTTSLRLRPATSRPRNGGRWSTS